MVVKTKPFDAAEYLKTDEDIAAYMTEALATRDVAVIGRALGAIARARGRVPGASGSGMSGEDLDRALGVEGNREFATVLRIIDALGLRLTVEPANKAA